jgi:TPP-dependent pyruvate/acetoin dehydrogenase alpha subunit
MGKATGVSGGRGGSQHLHWRNFYSNGILGGTAPLAVGMALAEKQKRSGAIVVIFLGDGALGEGVVYESLNLAGLWQLPILFVVENNQIAQTTPIHLNLSGDILTRFAAFGIRNQALDTSDVRTILEQAAAAQALVREDCQPFALVLNTVRFGPHSKGDDTRDPAWLAEMRLNRDPLIILGAQLDEAVRMNIEAHETVLLDMAYRAALEADTPDPAGIASQEI